MFLKAYGGQVLKTSIYANTLKTMHLVSSNDIVMSMLNKKSTTLGGRSGSAARSEERRVGKEC